MPAAVGDRLALERVPLDACDWEVMNQLPDRVIFQTREWLEFLTRTQGTEPVVAMVRRGDEQVGWFTGCLVRRLGVRILGSPFPGWTTTSMGFNLSDGVSRGEATRALLSFAFGPLRCVHLELRDWYLRDEDVAGLGLERGALDSLVVDLDLAEDEIFARMTSACRRAIRKAEKVGVRVEEAGAAGFAEEYYAQLVDVFAKQGLRPTYGLERVRELVECLHPTGRLLLLRAVAPDGTRMATGIFPAMNHTAYFWGGASWREHQIHRPNEALFWYAMRYWRSRGIASLELGGGGDYKLKYGPRELDVPAFRRSRYPGVGRMRDLAETVLTSEAVRRRVERVRPSRLRSRARADDSLRQGG